MAVLGLFSPAYSNKPLKLLTLKTFSTIVLTKDNLQTPLPSLPSRSRIQLCWRKHSKNPADRYPIYDFFMHLYRLSLVDSPPTKAFLHYNARPVFTNSASTGRLART
jgi:hypothetical protein